MTARELIETPDLTDANADWEQAAVSFGFVQGVCVLSMDNKKHMEVDAELRHATDGLEVETLNIALFSQADPTTSDENLRTVRAAVNKRPRAGGPRDVFAPAGRIWERPEKLVSFWVSLEAAPGPNKETPQRMRGYLDLLDAALRHYGGESITGYTIEFLNQRTDFQLRKVKGVQNWSNFNAGDEITSDDQKLVSKLKTMRTSQPLSPKEIAAALAKAHIEPHRMSPAEKEAVKAFRGSAPVSAPKRGIGGWEQAARAQGVPFQRIGDSVL